jgi:hypothetical protein
MEQTMNDLTERLHQWREGMLTNSEMLGYLLEAQAEVIAQLRKSEDWVTEQRSSRCGG